MSQILRNSFLTFAFLIAVAAAWFMFNSQPGNVEAAAPFPLTGYAWSDTVGWISMSCTDGGPTANNVCASSNYGVQIDNGTTKTISGYAWSEYAGWIQFGGGLSGCPSGSCAARVISDGSTGWEMTGWARALAYTDPSPGGWDGWISLNCLNNAGCATSDYTIRISSTGVVSSAANSTGSFAWGGGTTIGWVDFGYTSIGGTCPVNTTYSCIDPVTSRATTGDLWCVSPTIVDTDCSLTGKICDVGGTETCVAGPPTGSLTISPTVVRPGDTVTVNWTSTGTACTVTATGLNYSAGGSDGTTFSAPNNQTVVVLNCDGFDIASSTLNVIPSIFES